MQNQGPVWQDFIRNNGNGISTQTLKAPGGLIYKYQDTSSGTCAMVFVPDVKKDD